MSQKKILKGHLPKTLHRYATGPDPDILYLSDL